MTQPSAVELELARNAASLRSLARDLVGTDAAEDLVQETALRALRATPRDPRSLGGWLATVLRRLAATHHRAARRRDRREALAAVGESLPATVDLAARRESLRAVTAALFGLPEPYQSTLLWRYFEELTPSQIAARTATSVATVKTRLHRGLGLLRAALDGRQRDWRAALTLATGLAPATALTLTTGALLMTKTLKVGIAATIALATVAAWKLGDTLLLPPPATAAGGPVGNPTGAPIDSSPTTAAAERREIEPTVPFAGTDLAHPFAFVLRCRAIDADGLPAVGVHIAWSPRDCSEPRHAATDDAGSAVLEWSGRAPTMRMCVHAANSAPREVDVRAGADATLVLLAESTTATVFSVTMSEATLDVQGDFAPEAGSSIVSRTMETIEQRVSGSFSEPRHGMHPNCVFEDRLLSPAPEAGVQVLVQLPIGRFALIHTTELASLDYLAAIATVADPTGKIEGIVYGEDGTPADDVRVCVGLERDRPQAETRSAADGTFRLTGLPVGAALEVRAGGGAEGLARAIATAVPAPGPAVALALQRGQTIRGSAVAHDGQPLVDWIVDYEALDGGWADRATVAKDGTFLFANLPAAAGRLLLRRNQASIAATVVASMLPDNGSVALRLEGEHAANGSIVVRLPATDAGEPRDGTFRAWQADTGIGVELERREDGRFQLDGLPAGFYRLDGGATATGIADLSTHYVDGQGALDLGTTAAPRTGRLGIRNRPADGTVELYQRRSWGDVRCVCDPDDGPEFELPTGDWLLFWRRGDDLPRVASFSLRAGERTTVDLDD